MLNPSSMTDLRDAMIKASLEAERLFHSGEFTVSRKEDNSPLTEADLFVDQFLKERLSEIDPGSGWLSEETVDDASRLEKERVWIVDPIDGTREFTSEIPEFSISAGLSRNGIPVYGTVALPGERRLIYGGQDQPIRSVRYRFSDDKDWPSLQMEEPKTSTRKELSGSRVMVSRSEWGKGKYEKLIGDFDFEPTGSIARKLALLAVGEADMVVSLTPKNEWDICGGTALIRSIPDYSILELKTGENVKFNSKKVLSTGLVAGPTGLVEQFLEYIRSKKISISSGFE